MRVDLEETAVGHPDAPDVAASPRAEQMEQLVAMGMVEGMTEAMGQIDAVLADG